MLSDAARSRCWMSIAAGCARDAACPGSTTPTMPAMITSTIAAPTSSSGNVNPSRPDRHRRAMQPVTWASLLSRSAREPSPSTFVPQSLKVTAGPGARRRREESGWKEEKHRRPPRSTSGGRRPSRGEAQARSQATGPPRPGSLRIRRCCSPANPEATSSAPCLRLQHPAIEPHHSLRRRSARRRCRSPTPALAVAPFSGRQGRSRSSDPGRDPRRARPPREAARPQGEHPSAARAPPSPRAG